jgi:hypothetical protein
VTFLAAFALVLLVLALRQRRHLEFMMPTVILLIGAVWGWYAQAVDVKALWQELSASYRRPRLVGGVIVVYFAIVAAWLAVAAVTGTARLNREPANDWSAAAGATSYLAAHVTPGETVFYDNWSDFPKLFYFAPDLRGLAGLDPVFFYRRDSQAFRDWRAIADGKVASPAVASAARFGTAYLLVRTENKNLIAQLEAEGAAERSYQDQYFQVFHRRD